MSLQGRREIELQEATPTRRDYIMANLEAYALVEKFWVSDCDKYLVHSPLLVKLR